MDDPNTKRNTCLFIVFLLLAGVANALTYTRILAFDALMCECSYLIYVGLLLFWIQSVRARLLPSRERAWLIGAALMMLFYLLLRIFKYRFTEEVIPLRYAVYLYFVPMTMIPTFFLIACLRILRGHRAGRWDEALLLIPQGLLSLLAVTNDLHRLVYVPKIALNEFTVNTGTYTYGPVFYALYGWMILSFAAGLILLLRESMRQRGKALLFLLVAVAAWFGMLLIYMQFIDGIYGPHMYNTPEINMFGMLGVLEVCIRYHLIPHNANYADFFATLRIPALVTDGALRPVYRTEGGIRADADQLRAALKAPVYLTPDLKLTGRAVRGGYAFWVEDETEVHRAQERLEEANELIASENSLIQAETEQREKDAWLQSRHRIYHEIAETLYPCQQRIERLLSEMEPASPSFRDQLAFVSVLNAYVKRKSNLLLLEAEKEALTTHDLYAALEESARYLTLAGLPAAVAPEEEASPSGQIIALYDAFQAVVERLIGSVPSLMVSVNRGSVILAMEAARVPDLKDLPVPARSWEADGVLYLDLLAQEGGERA